MIRIELEDGTQQKQKENEERKEDNDGEAVKARVSPEVSGFRKGMGLKAWSAPSTAKKSNTPAARNTTVRRRKSPSVVMWGL